MVGYSSGVALVARGRDLLPAIVDLVVLLLVWMGAFWLRAALDVSRLTALAVGLLMGLLVGALVTAVRLTTSRTPPPMPKSELPEHVRDQGETAVSPNLLRRLWDRWNVFAIRMGSVQARLFMSYFYFIIVTPFALLGKLLGDPLHTRHSPTETAWSAREPVAADVEAAREQG